MCLLLFHTDCLPASPLLSWVPPGRLSNLSQMPFRSRYSLIKTFHISKAPHCFKIQSSPFTPKFKCSLTWSLKFLLPFISSPCPSCSGFSLSRPTLHPPGFPLTYQASHSLPGTQSLHVLLALSGSDLKTQVEGHHLCGPLSLHG